VDGSGRGVKVPSDDLFRRARAVTPGGVNSPVRAWRAVGQTPRFIARGSGAWIWDTEGRRYLDFLGSWGPLVLGHAFPSVVAAVERAAEQGTSFGAPTLGEVELAEVLVGALPGAEQVRLVTSGTEAVMTAIRLARAQTGRRRIVKFAGCYHGHSDGLLVRAGSGGLTLGIPDSAGIPSEIAGLTAVAPFNDLGGVRRILSNLGGEVAAIIVEPVAGNMGTVLPAPGFLEGLRDLATRSGALLIFDEVITGFRVGWGGAQALFGVAPDLTCLGKIIGGGLPLAAVAGPRAIMEQLAPSGSVYQAGTLSGNPIAVSAGLATLRELASGTAYERLEGLGGVLEATLGSTLAGLRRPVCLNRCGSMFTLFLGVGCVETYGDAVEADTTAFGRFFHALLERGVYVAPSQFEAAFISLAHTEADVRQFAAAVAESLAEVL
jgi:glutamate-1-semialdehyde 2,1-aminomutase